MKKAALIFCEEKGNVSIRLCHCSDDYQSSPRGTLFSLTFVEVLSKSLESMTCLWLNSLRQKKSIRRNNSTYNEKSFWSMPQESKGPQRRDHMLQQSFVYFIIHSMIGSCEGTFVSFPTQHCGELGWVCVVFAQCSRYVHVMFALSWLGLE